MCCDNNEKHKAENLSDKFPNTFNNTTHNLLWLQTSNKDSRMDPRKDS